MTGWSGRSAWVIGASSGIGAAVAQELLRRGCDVTISARSESALHDVAQGRMRVVPIDISDSRSVEQAAAAVGRFDVVIVVAGYWKQMSGRAFDYEVFARHNDVNVLGLARCIAAVVPPMLRQGSGTFVGVSSVAGYRGMLEHDVHECEHQSLWSPGAREHHDVVDDDPCQQHVQEDVEQACKQRPEGTCGNERHISCD